MNARAPLDALRATGAPTRPPADDAPPPAARVALHQGYLEAMALVERLHRLLLDVIKDEFERLGLVEVNPVQALMLFHVAENEVTAGELRTRGYYQGSNVSYNLKRLVEMGYMHHRRSEVDRRSVRIRLTEKGRRLRDIVARLFAEHVEAIEARGVLDLSALDDTTRSLRRLERFWADRIRYIY